ncbi:MAG: pentapeptide repeat-containing protein [Phormidesmis sp.]
MNYQHLLEDNVELWNHWRRQYPDLLPNLAGRDLSRCYLFEANLSGVNLSGANLSRACLIGADLSYANLSRADLRHAYLDKANLLCANLWQADLSGTRLQGALERLPSPYQEPEPMAITSAPKFSSFVQRWQPASLYAKSVLARSASFSAVSPFSTNS